MAELRSRSRSRASTMALLGVIAACSAKPARVEVPQQEGVRTTYDRGAPVLHAEKINRVTVKLAERREDDLVLGILVANGQAEAFEIAPDDVHPSLEARDGTRVAATVYSFEELPKSDDDSLVWGAAQAASGVAAIPIGGIWGSLARAIMQLGISAGRGQATGEAGAAPNPVPIAEAYLSRQTVEPGQEYEGIVLARLPREPEPGESLLVVVNVGNEEHAFRIRFVAA